jgi:hypothetical protein
MKCIGLKTVLISALAASALVAPAQSVNLTGITWYTTDSSKHYTGGFANTFGGDTYSRNLYVTENQAVGGGPLANSLNLTTAPTRVNFDLSAAGTYAFQMYCNDESTTSNPFWGLNLFFNGNDTQSSISAWNVVNIGGFQTITPTGTPTLDPLTMGLVQGGSSGLAATFYSGLTTVSLTSYSTWSANHYNADRVDNFSDAGGLGNGTRDNVIEFTLHVTTVPEPATLIGFGVATCTLALRRRRKAARS